MPKELRRFKPSSSVRVTTHPRLAELQAAKSWGYKLSDWQSEDIHFKAEMIAEHYVTGMIESYCAEQIRRESAKI